MKIYSKIKNRERVDIDDVVRDLATQVPLLYELERTSQDEEWHAEGNVKIHTDMVMKAMQDIAAAREGADYLTAVMAAAFHDVAKPQVTKQVEIDGKLRTVAPRHAHLGRSYLAMRDFSDKDFLPSQFDKMLALVGHHHDPRKLVHEDATRNRYAALSRLCDIPMLYELCRADMTGRLAADYEQQLETVEMFKLQAQEYDLWDQGVSVMYDTWMKEIQSAFPNRGEDFHQHAWCRTLHDYEKGIIQSIHEGVARAWELPEKRFDFTLLCGPSGSGKSSWINDFVGGEHVVSLDEVRVQIAGDREDQSKNGQVMQMAKQQLKAALRAKKSIVYEATNTRMDGRSRMIQMARDYGAFTKIVCFRTPIDELLRRNKLREHPIPTSALMHQIERFEFPYQNEADSVVYIDNF